MSLLIALVLAQAAPRNAERTAPPDLDARRQHLAALLDEHWEYTMRTSPEYASLLGDKRYNDRLSDFSEADRARIREQMLAAIRDDVRPAYQRFARFVEEEYAPKGRAEPGIWSLDVLEKRIAAWTAQGRQGAGRGAALH